MVTTVKVRVKNYTDSSKKSYSEGLVVVTIDGSLKLTEIVMGLLKSIPDSEIK